MTPQAASLLAGSVPEKWGMFIGGEFVPSESGRYAEVTNPATEEVIAEVPAGTPADVEHAVAKAREAFKTYREMPGRERGRLLARLAAAMQERFDEFAELECVNQGKPIRHVRGFDIPNAIETLEYYAGAATKLRGISLDSDPAMFGVARREPYGVVGQIVPWNYPVMMASWKIAPALAAGNAVVILPALNTPLTLLRLAELAKEVGFPDGVLNVVTGEGPVVGDALTRHPQVRKIGFTGSTATGRLVTNNASLHSAPVTLELGGKSANIFFDDVGMEQSLKKAVLGTFHNAGQMCLAGSRLFLHDSIHDEFVERMAAYADKMRVGDPQDAKTQVGPVVSKRQLDRVLGYIEDGKKSGAKLVAGGGTPDDLERGHYVRPTIFVDVPADSRIGKEEIFGPVSTVFRFHDEEEVIAWANDSDYGLAAGIHTNDLSRAHRLANKIEAGTVWVNTYAYLTPAAPYGGYKESGHGRELGMEGLEAYTQLKTIFISPNRG